MRPPRSAEETAFLEDFARQLRRARRVLGLSQSALAEEIDVHPSSVQQWEKGTSAPSTVLYLRIRRKVLKRAAEVQAAKKVADWQKKRAGGAAAV